MKNNYDVIVVGGGPAGIGAALGAAEKGADTLLIEQYGFLGGMWTAGLVNPVFDHHNKKGILSRLIYRLKQENSFGGFIDSCFQIETMKYVLDDMILEAGVKPLYHTICSLPIMEGDRVVGVEVENKNGRVSFYAHTVIDCTGDGDVAARAGADFQVGRTEDGKCQAMTLMFQLGNLEFAQLGCYELYERMKKAIEEQHSDYRIVYDRPYIIQLPGVRQAVVQLTHIRGQNGLDAFDLTQAEIEGRRQVRETIKLFRQIPELKDAELIATAPHIGVRDSRRILGEYTLTKEDCMEGRQFYDGIVTATFNMDVHNPEDIQQTCYDTKPYQIPYRCLIPKGKEGLLVAGRCISGSFEAQSSYRVTGNCIAMGEAAGNAAALAKQHGCGTREVPLDELLKKD